MANSITQSKYKVKVGGTFVDPSQVWYKSGVVFQPIFPSGGNGLLNSLVSYWTLNEATGSRIDSHGVNNLSVVGTVGSAAGILNNAASMDQTGYLAAGGSGTLRITGALSISVWVNSASLANDNWGIVAKSEGVGNQRCYSTLLASDNKFRFIISPDGATNIILRDETIVVSPGVWYHLCAVYEPSTAMRIYINGVQSAVLTSGAPASINAANNALWIGQQFASTSNLRFDGLIDETGIWSRALSPADVAALYNAGAGLAYGSFTA